MLYCIVLLLCCKCTALYCCCFCKCCTALYYYCVCVQGSCLWVWSGITAGVWEGDLVIVTVTTSQRGRPKCKDVFGYVRKVTHTPLNRLKNRHGAVTVPHRISECTWQFSLKAVFLNGPLSDPDMFLCTGQEIEKGSCSDKDLLGVVVYMGKIPVSEQHLVRLQVCRVTFFIIINIIYCSYKLLDYAAKFQCAVH